MTERDDRRPESFEAHATYRRVTTSSFRETFEIYKYTHGASPPVQPRSVIVTPRHYTGAVVGDVAFRVQCLDAVERDVQTIYEGIADPSVTHDLTGGRDRYVILDRAHVRVVTSNPLVSPEDSNVELEIRPTARRRGWR